MRRAFTVIELLVVIAVVALLVSLVAPGLSSARQAARGVACASNQRQLISAWHLYANDYAERAMPLAYWSSSQVGAGPQVFWWGAHGAPSTPVDFARGFIAPYLDATLGTKSVFECPSQPWGSYRPQGPARQPTSTYGYNGYYLSPECTPGWAGTIGSRPWKRIGDIPNASSVLVFADTILPSGPPGGSAGRPSNTALLDPPELYQGAGEWTVNEYPTTAFRHRPGRVANAAIADGSVRNFAAENSWIMHSSVDAGSILMDDMSWYVPDRASWR